MVLIFSLAFKLFLLMDPIGNVPLYISFLKKIPAKRQRKIIFRELIIALVIIIIFNYIGRPLLHFLSISNETVKIAGGIILFILSIRMIFPPADEHAKHISKDVEPFIVPLAVPLVAGPAVLAAVMIFAQQERDSLLMVLSIAIAWAASLIILLLAPTLGRVLGQRGIIALERLMGLVLTLIAVEMFLEGFHNH